MTTLTFARALAKRRHHVCPFLVLGDPTPETSVELALAALDGGAAMLELGIPYDDPCADGPAIQAACVRARAAGVSTGVALEILAAIHQARPEAALNLLVYGNLVHARGLGVFCRDVARAGAATLLVPDIPLEESRALQQACRAADLGHVALVAPATDAARIAAHDATAPACLYLAAYQGVTGSTVDASADRRHLVQRTRGVSARPLAVGFGLSAPADVLSVFSDGAQIAIVGSHLARVIGNAHGRDDDVVGAFAHACTPLLQVTPTD